MTAQKTAARETTFVQVSPSPIHDKLKPGLHVRRKHKHKHKRKHKDVYTFDKHKHKVTRKRRNIKIWLNRAAGLPFGARFYSNMAD